MPVERASTNLLIGQWANAANMRALIDAFLDDFQAEVRDPIDDLALMRRIDSAEGIWLDYLGQRLGIARPHISIADPGDRFGFDEAGVGFDQEPFSSHLGDEVTSPLPDIVYQKLLRARSVALFTRGEFADLRTACRYIHDNASVIDNLDMTVTVVTDLDFLWQFHIADETKALPRVAGVRIIYRDRGRFGFDMAGVPFDVGPFAGVGGGVEPTTPIIPPVTPSGDAYDDAYDEAYG